MKANGWSDEFGTLIVPLPSFDTNHLLWLRRCVFGPKPSYIRHPEHELERLVDALRPYANTSFSVFYELADYFDLTLDEVRFTDDEAYAYFAFVKEIGHEVVRKHMTYGQLRDEHYSPYHWRAFPKEERFMILEKLCDRLRTHVSEAETRPRSRAPPRLLPR